jgi:hypothetical protein
MKLITRILIILTLFIILAGTFTIVAWDMPAPSTVKEKIISNDRFR